MLGCVLVLQGDHQGCAQTCSLPISICNNRLGVSESLKRSAVPNAQPQPYDATQLIMLLIKHLDPRKHG